MAPRSLPSVTTNKPLPMRWWRSPSLSPLHAQGGGQAAGGEEAGEKVGKESRRPYSAQSRVSWIKILPGFVDGAIREAPHTT